EWQCARTDDLLVPRTRQVHRKRVLGKDLYGAGQCKFEAIRCGDGQSDSAHNGLGDRCARIRERVRGSGVRGASGVRSELMISFVKKLPRWQIRNLCRLDSVLI